MKREEGEEKEEKGKKEDCVIKVAQKVEARVVRQV